jgi:hypothetical protein
VAIDCAVHEFVFELDDGVGFVTATKEIEISFV